ncbi:dihydroneopterin aldolase [Simiduia agarivorans]|uniref:7,8-dihydroneopterin aldolase n=1 Tax=Simiduia agarivorans (strain DSM 21679 / JCM 13881 / BCRC 17597 / SA1) TaxID=1117647 RepID=K4KLN6_SIMAS|nr:dihydroneopterin aldolase [Simiduia agarivorans]AFU99135.1 dihydroneopterin aldolase [Simiduia agarivorans SA1 = DSM 21679]
MTDQIMIEGLWIETVIGVYDWERELRQRLLLDLTLTTDIRPAAASDDLGKTLDYKAITDRIIAFAEGSSHQLVETLAEQIAALVQKEFGVTRLTLKLSKPGALPRAQNVAVFIERGR